MSLSLASCTAAMDGAFRPAERQAGVPAAALAPGPAAPTVPMAPVAVVVPSASADPSTSILAYHGDLEACRRTASAALGPGALDDVAALKRAVADGAGRTATEGAARGAVTVSHRSDDLAVRRDRAVKACLSKRGYVLKD